MRTDPMGKFCHPEKRSVVGQCEGVCRSIAFVRDDALYGKSKTPSEETLTGFLVPRTRLELTRANAHHPLKVACLPIPPPGPRFPPQRVFRCANIVTILFFPKYTAKKLPGHETDPAIRRCFRSVRRSRQRAARLLRKTVYSAKSISSKR